MQSPFSQIKICIVCALDCEAAPLIRHFALKPEKTAGAFRIYGNSSLALVVSGVGRKAAEAGTTSLGERLRGKDPAVWLNIGIAGHPTRPIREAVIAGKILDRQSGKSWYPHLAFRPDLPADVLVTVEKPSALYPGDFLYDMEGSGFYPAALRYSTSELVHCIKVISDNRLSPSSEIRPGRVREWVAGAIPEIEMTLRKLGGLAEKRRPLFSGAALMKQALDRWRFTEYQRNELGGLLRRIYALKLEGEVQISEIAEIKNSREFLSHLKFLLEVSLRRAEHRNSFKPSGFRVSGILEVGGSERR